MTDLEELNEVRHMVDRLRVSVDNALIGLEKAKRDLLRTLDDIKSSKFPGIENE